MNFDVPTLPTSDAGLLHVACVQLASNEQRDDNLARAERGVRLAAARGARVIALAEKWNIIGEREVLERGAEPIDGPTIRAIRSWASELGCWILAGSIVVRDPGEAKLRNLSILVSPEGEIAAQYAKAHMFDVDVAGVSYRESDAERPGDSVCVSEIDGVSVGLSVCYDLRFPELYRVMALRGARIMFVPAAFTMMTGRDHWEVLLRARAIENQCFVIAPNIIGDHGAGKVSYGRSMIIDPWGTVLACAPDAEAVIDAHLDLAAVDRMRAAIPALATRQPALYAGLDS